MDYIPAIVSLVGALGLGSVLGQFISGGHQRRQIRSDVLQRLTAVESARWEPDVEAFTKAARNLEAAALIARVPRQAIDRYTTLARRALDQLVDSNDDEIGWVLPAGPVTSNVEAAAQDVVALIWSPWIARLRRIHRTPLPAAPAD